MMGERVAVLRRAMQSRDEMGEPVYAWTPELVENCLVKTLTSSDLAVSNSSGEASRPEGVSLRYNIAFPKAYTQACAPLRGCRVALVERGMDEADADAALIVSGEPDVTNPCPTMWDMIATVGRAHG